MAAGQTIIIYGGLTFFNVLTKHVNAEAMYDDSGTDEIGRRFTISVVAHIHGLPTAKMGILPSTQDGDAANSLVQLRYLLAPRQHFEYRMGAVLDQLGNILNSGTPVLICDPANNIGSTNISLCDINNGPKAHALNVTHVAGDSLLTCEVDFEICQLQCAADGTTANATGILNNRWTVVDDIDCQNWMTRRTFTGKIRCSSAQVNPHAFRYACVPPLQPGMRRANMNFAASEDGLSLMYSITDEEIAFAPPAPATTWNASFTQRVEYDRIGHYYDASISLGGDRNCDLKKLISLASSMALSKFSNGVRLANDNRYRVISIEVSEHYTDKAAGINLHATAMRTDFEGPDKLQLNTKFLGVPITGAKISDVAPDYDPSKSRGTRPGDQIETSGPISIAAAFSAYMQSACGINFSINNGIAAAAKAQPQGGATTTVSSTVPNSDIPPDGSITTTYSPNNGDGAYSYYKIQEDVDVEYGRAQAPRAASQTPPGSSDSYEQWKAQYGSVSTPSSTIVDLHPPVTKKLVTIDAERVGTPPIIPVPKDLSDGSKVDKSVTEQLGHTPSVDGKKVFRARQRIWYLIPYYPFFQPDDAGVMGAGIPFWQSTSGFDQQPYSQDFNRGAKGTSVTTIVPSTTQ
jgi:hypothetical protein